MSDKNNASDNKELNNSSQNKIQEQSQQNNSSSPSQNYSNSFQPFANTEINQRNFPSKANYFGQNGNRNNSSIDRAISPGNQSPVLNYYTSLSPKYSKISQYYSPEQNYGSENAKHSPFTGGNINSEQTFNFSPSTIFNISNQKSNNNNYNVFNNNYNNHQITEGFSNNKSLAEKMEHLVGKNDDNNFMSKNNNEQKSDEEDDNENEMYLLTLNICDDKENEEEINNNFSHNITDFSNQVNNINNNQFNKSNTNTNTNSQLNNNEMNIIPKSLDNNNNQSDFINNNFKNINENINNSINNNLNNKQNIQKNENENNIEEENIDKKEKEEIGEKLIIKNELPKPYIPNKYRNNIMEINQINNNLDDNMLPSYGGPINNNGLINNFTINNNINNNFNINNNIINNNLIGNQNFNFGYNNINNQSNNYMVKNNQLQMMNEKEASPFPSKIGEFLNFSNRTNNYNPNENNKFEMNNFPQVQSVNYFNNNNNNNFNNINNNNNNYINNFYYNKDIYQISQFKQYKKSDNSKNGQIHSICADDFVTTITANNKKIKRIDPNTYLNESLEYLAFNIYPLAKDQAGCRFLQEKLDQEPLKSTELFFNAIIPHILNLVKDPFGNYLIQKLCNTLNPDQIIKILEVISPTILDIGSNNHGTRVIQHLINFLTTKKLVDYFLKSIEPYVIPLLKELNGTHIIQQFLIKHPDCSEIINKIIVENCASLASHSHGCCVLQKFLNGRDKNLKEMLINNLINNCLVLIIDQYGNYVIQSILLLNEAKSSSAIAMKIYDNVAYYSKHRYSSNVVEKCFDFCGKNERKKLAEKLSPPDILADLIMDEHGNYVVQKALSCSDSKEQEIILKNIIPLIPKIKNVSFGEKLLARLMATYPQFKNNVQMIEGNNTLSNINDNNNNLGNMNYNNFSNLNNNINNINSGYYNYKKGNKKKKGGKNNNYYFDNNMGFNNNNFYNNNNSMNNNMESNMNNNIYFKKNENFENDGRNFGNEGKNQYKNRGNKKNYKNNWRDRDDQKKSRKNNNFNNFNNNEKNYNDENNK